MSKIPKIKNDKYYTSPELAKYCTDKTKEIIGEQNITQYIEPSAGNAVFLDYLPEGTLAYDIEPEDIRVEKQNYLTLNLDYLKGRCIIGNPPYGRANNLAVQFYKKSIQLGDYIAFILPISQYNNNIKLYEFDTIYSENLGVRDYSDRKVHCCLNIYKRNINGKLNSSPNYKLKDVEIREARKIKNSKRSQLITKNDFNYDIRIMGWGGGIGRINQLGCEVQYEGQFAKEFLIKIKNITYKEQVLKLIKNVHWGDIYLMTATPNLCQWQILKYIKEQIPEIE